ncbi:MAG: glutamate 5-kinase [Planctomycetota bacterium]
MAGPQLIVIKLGSGVVAPGGTLDRERLTRLALDMAGVIRAGTSVVLVSSGAVAAGFEELGLAAMPTTIVGKQAAAAVGQSRLVGAWASAFDPAGIAVAQVLLTAEDLDHRSRFLNARRTLETLIDAGVVPIINANDSVSHDTSHFGDNDRLSAHVASALDADQLVVLSVVGGVQDDSGGVVAVIEDIGRARRWLRDEASSVGTGGMSAKLDAADIAVDAGIPVTIAAASTPGLIARLVAGERVGTHLPARAARSARKRWIGHAARPRGSVIIDDGASRALRTTGASLLPAGVTSVEGEFEAGSVIEIRDGAGAVIARGLSAYASHEVRRLAGRRSDEIASILGYVYAEEIVHRTDMHVTAGSTP